MFSEEEIKIIKEATKEFFKKTTFDCQIDFYAPEERTLPINVRTDEPQILIGEGGQTLAEIQHLLKAIIKKKIEEQFYVNLDINSYKEKKTEHLKEMANSMADEVSLLKKEKTLAPMPAYERRIVHMELAKRNDVATESIGEDPDRRLVIKPN